MKRLTVSTLLVLLNSLYLYSFSGAGSGTESDPYQITNVQQLQEIDDDRNAHYILINDIDAGDTKNWNVGDHDDDASTPDSAMGFDPIGEYSLSFEGSLNGNGFAISDLYINRPSLMHVGLIGYADKCEIENIKLNECEIYGKSSIGSLAGKINYSFISNVFAGGVVIGDEQVGGLVGETSYSAIVNSHVNIRVRTYTDCAGGIAAYASDGCICNSYSDGEVKGDNDIGGIAGTNFQNRILNSYSSSLLMGKSYIGGIAGSQYYTSKYNDMTYIINSYSTGKVIGNYYVGGIVGNNKKGLVKYSYSVATIYGLDSLGGIAGGNQGRIESCFCDLDLCGIENPGYGEGKTTEEMKTDSIYIDAGWNFDCVWATDNGYPYIDTSNGLQDTDGDGYYEISTIDELRKISENAKDIDKNLELTANIDASDTKYWNGSSGFLPIIFFNREFKGNNYIINDLYINLPDYGIVGIFAQVIGKKSIISDLNIEDIEIVADSYIGGLAGQFFYGSISNSKINGSIKGNNITGGFIGENNQGHINNCSADILIEGEDYLGGICGKTFGCELNKCVSKGQVTGNLTLGGMVGYFSASSILNSHSYTDVNGLRLIGGLIGFAYSGTVSQCSSHGDISGNQIIGGLIGQTDHADVQIVCSYGVVSGSENVGGLIGYHGPLDLVNSFSMCNVHAEINAGGLVGMLLGNVRNSYSTGLVAGDNNGGLIGAKVYHKEAQNSFWNIETSGLDSSSGGIGKTSTEMKTKPTYTDADWDFDTIWAISPEKNYGYPYFQWMEDIVGVEELPVMEMQLIKAYPNPVDNYLHISCPLGFSDKLNVRISDAAGNLVRDLDVVNINNELTVPVDGLSAGAYYMNIISGGEVYSVRFVVE